MRIKSYFSNTVEAAVQMAREELGEDALLVQSRPAPPDARHLGTYEVVFAMEDAPAVAQRAPAHAEQADLASISELGLFLLTRDVDLRLVRQIESSITSEQVGEDEVRNALGNQFRTGSGEGGTEQRVLALVGPPGTGKTSLVIKLAVKEAQAMRGPVEILSCDSRRVGAGEPLRTLAAIAGFNFDLVPVPERLGRYLAARRQAGLILIDTPGFAPSEAEEMQALASVLRKISGIQTHLVVTAHMRTADLSNAAERYRVFQPGWIAATRWDESESSGGVISLSAATGWPISWLGTGPSVPEHLEAASRDVLLDRIVGRPARAAAKAAGAR
jgi:flagellar biosynthesis protein FlhF